MGIERLIPRVASLTVDCRGVNISLTKPIWKLSNDKSVRLRYFVKRNSMLLLYCCDHHYDLCFLINMKTSAVFKVGILQCTNSYRVIL